ncbi:uncharacterized protein CC84DRAFT_1227309 [Paraphaeosphaeria sporulosa]|uniref:Uncharacterized protein n=1 Tax=Paraphaeosphaeria sporulosa TaxID=1460663 RepID=A0A177CYY9_9PLEO|nr:uncharacterized protein CC84DRAFT_1227309 [Paraphaeosphaeria sporulosa]OAG12723.1 hypothetical protein CC84DRAFT_1227309 [Paraphaeosphaeria sporulosa]
MVDAPACPTRFCCVGPSAPFPTPVAYRCVAPLLGPLPSLFWPPSLSDMQPYSRGASAPVCHWPTVPTRFRGRGFALEASLRSAAPGATGKQTVVRSDRLPSMRSSHRRSSGGSPASVTIARPRPVHASVTTSTLPAVDSLLDRLNQARHDSADCASSGQLQPPQAAPTSSVASVSATSLQRSALDSSRRPGSRKHERGVWRCDDVFPMPPACLVSYQRRSATPQRPFSRRQCESACHCVLCLTSNQPGPEPAPLCDSTPMSSRNILPSAQSPGAIKIYYLPTLMLGKLASALARFRNIPPLRDCATCKYHVFYVTAVSPDHTGLAERIIKFPHDSGSALAEAIR